MKFRDITDKGINYSEFKAAYVVDNPSVLKGLRHLSRGDVLVTASAHSGDQIGKKCAYVDRLPEVKGGVYFVGELLGITSNPKIMHSKWPYYWFLSDNGFREVQSAVAGVHLTSGRAQNMPIPFAPLDEQKRIVAKVEELLARVNAARERLAKVQTSLKRFRQAVLSAACSGRLTADWRNGREKIETGKAVLQQISGNKGFIKVPNNEDPIELPEIPERWAWSRCEYLSDPKRIITYGVIKLGPAFEDGVGVLRSSDVRWLQIDKDHVKRISPDIAAKYSRTFLKGGEILVTVRGTLGGISVVPMEMAGYNISREVALVPLHPKLDTQFFSYAIASIWSQNWLSEVTKGVAYTGINIKDLKRLPLPVPPIAEQREIVTRVKALFRLADAIGKRVEAATGRAEKLTQAILAKAFRGQLVSTEAELARCKGRSYEPASVLLARIKAEQEEKGN